MPVERLRRAADLLAARFIRSITEFIVVLPHVKCRMDRIADEEARASWPCYVQHINEHTLSEHLMNHDPTPASQPSDEKRNLSDRRRQPTSFWGAFPPAGRRMRNRRAEEHRLPYFVDRYTAMMLTVVLMLVLASIVDAVLTIRLIQAGGSEINPLMRRLLDFGTFPFLLGKYALTVVGLPLLIIFKNHTLFGTRFRVGYLIPILVVLYAVLISYQLILMYNHSVPVA